MSAPTPAIPVTVAAIERRLQASKLRISANHPFFSSLLLMAPTEVTGDVPTAATDGRRLFFNPEFVAPLSSEQLDGLVVHELLHCALLHTVRRGPRDAQLWNIAADIHINGLIRKLAHLDLPSGCCEMPSLAAHSAEEIYDRLRRIKSRTDGPRSRFRMEVYDLQDPVGADGQPLSPAEADRLRGFWSDAVHRAEATARGDPHAWTRMPALLERSIAETHAPRLDWRSALWRHVVQTPDDYSGFDRRHLWQGLYVEELQGEGLDVDVCIDTSGSVDEEQLRDFLSELRGILSAYPAVRCRLYYADAACTGPFDVAADRPLPVANGGGGTDFRPFFHCTSPGAGDAEATPRANGGIPRLAVYLTDGFGTFPEAAPDRPVLWVVTPGGLRDGGFPFGEVVRMVGAPGVRP